MFCLESTEVSIKEVRCFRFPVPSLSYSYVSTSGRRDRLFPAYPEKNCNTFLLSPKKSFEKKPTFPTPIPQTSCFYWQFRMQDWVQDCFLRVQDSSFPIQNCTKKAAKQIWFLTVNIKKLHDSNQFYAGLRKSARGGISNGVVLSERLIENNPFLKTGQ